jgi:hypothetical protein
VKKVEGGLYIDISHVIAPSLCNCVEAPAQSHHLRSAIVFPASFAWALFFFYFPIFQSLLFFASPASNAVAPEVNAA